MLNKFEHLKEEYLIQYIQPLINLDIPSICQSIEELIFSIEHDHRFAYRSYLNRETFDTYLKDKKKNQIKALKNYPRPVIPFYELLETLVVVSNTFKELDSIPLRGTKSTITLPQNTWTLIQSNIPDIYQRLQQLSRSHVLIHQLLLPILNPAQNKFNELHLLSNQAQEHIHQLSNPSNKEKIRQMAPRKEGGLAVLTKLVVLTPHLLKELTQYIETGDTNINFDPNSSELIKLENAYVKALQTIAEPHQTTMQGLIKLLRELPKTVSSILKELMNTSQASAKKLAELKEKFIRALYAIQVELETLEENLALEKDTLVKPYLENREFLITKYNQTILSLKKLPNDLKPYVQITNIMRMEFKAQDKKDTLPSTLTIKPDDPKEKKVPTLNLLQSERLKRLKLIEFKQKSRYQAYQDFFEALLNAKKYPYSHSLKTLENFSMMIRYNKYYSMVQAIQDLSEKQKIQLKDNYGYIQPYFQAQSPQLDAALVQCLEAKDGDKHIYMPHQGTNFEYCVRVYLIAALIKFGFEKSVSWMYGSFMLMFTSYVIYMPHQGTNFEYWVRVSLIAELLRFGFKGNISWIYGAFMLMFISYVYYFPLQNQLDLLLKHRKAIEAAIGQEKTHESHLITQIKARFADENIHPDEYRQLIKISEKAPDIQKPYDSAFSLLRKNQPSEQITHFLEKTLYPCLSKILKPEILIIIPYDSLPFSYSATDDDIVHDYKKLINAFYHLKITLKELEHIDHQYNDERQFIVQAWNVIAILLPILTSGLQIVNDIQKILQNPLFIATKNDCITCLKGIYQTLTAQYPLIKIPSPSNDEAINEYQKWLKYEEIYQGQISKVALAKNPSIENINSVTVVVPPPLAEEKKRTTTDYLNQFNETRESIHQQYQLIFKNQKALLPAGLNEKVTETTRTFFKLLENLIQDKIYAGDQKKAMGSIRSIEDFDWTINSFKELLKIKIDFDWSLESFINIFTQMGLSNLWGNAQLY